jgi:hypothetical protein
MGSFGESSHIETQTIEVARVVDFGVIFEPNPEHGFGAILGHPGGWVIRSAVADTGSTLSLMTLTLTALGVAARQFKRAAA